MNDIAWVRRYYKMHDGAGECAGCPDFKRGGKEPRCAAIRQGRPQECIALIDFIDKGTSHVSDTARDTGK